MESILDVVMTCTKCGAKSSVRDAIPYPNGGVGLGCPMPDCDGFLDQLKAWRESSD